MSIDPKLPLNRAQVRRPSGRIIRFLLLFGLSGAFSAQSANAEEFCYVVIFGSQSQPKQLRRCHTWATFVRAVGTGTHPNNYELFTHTISWYPASRQVTIWTPFPEPGVNLSLEETLATVLPQEERVAAYGPFLITPTLFNRSVQVHNTLLTGAVQYRAIDTAANKFVSDCIHAVAAADPVFGRAHYPLIRVGQSASRYIAKEIVRRSPESGIVQTHHDSSWLIPRLGLDRYPITVFPPAAIARGHGSHGH